MLTNLLGETDLLDLGRFASQPELFAAVAEAIEARTRAQAVLVIFEDAHWADPGSLALLEFLSDVVARTATDAVGHGTRRCGAASRRSRSTQSPIGRSQQGRDRNRRTADRRP